MILSNETLTLGETVSFEEPTLGDYSPVCFASGTLIRTAQGDIAIEDLQVGDLVVTATGAHRPIRWLGHRATNCRLHPRPHEALPVRIVAGALGENRPARDLVVSPGHSICLDLLGEVLIPASALVNGTTITQEDVETVTYWHVELDSHDILIAEGQPAESYLDMGNRRFFAEAGVVSLFASPDATVLTHADFCRPFHDGGFMVEMARSLIQARAERFGWRLDGNDAWAGAHLMVDGERIEPEICGHAARFALPASAKDVWLISQTSVPSDVGENADQRQLGLCLRSLAFADALGGTHSIALDDALLCLGFHKPEPDHRWTAGRSRIPAALFAELDGPLSLHIESMRPALPRWVMGADAVPAPRAHGVTAGA